MKKIVSLALFSILSLKAAEPALVSQGDQASVIVRRISQDAVEKNKTAIAKIMAHDRYKGYGLKAIAALGATYMAYTFYQAWNNRGLPVGASANPIPFTEQGFNQMQYILEQQGQNAAPAFGSWIWLKRMASLLRDHVISTVMVSSAWSAGENQIKAINHPESIDWFVRTHTNFMPIFDELRQCGPLLENVVFTPQERAMPAHLVSMVCDSLVAQLELILGYIECKQESATGEPATQMTEIIRYIFNNTVEFAERIEHMLNDASLDGKQRRQAFESMVNAYKRELDRLVMRYHHLEKSLGE